MSKLPPEAIEAAHKAWREQAGTEGSIFEYNLQAALDAATPHIHAQALEEAADDFGVNLTVMSGPRIRAWLRARIRH